MPEGLAPFWATDNISLASDYWDKIKDNQSVIKRLDWATQGLSYPFHSIFLSVPSTVLTTAIKEDSFELMESLNYLGTNLGLWPGLGLFQLFEVSIIVILAYKMFDKFKFILAPTID